MSLKKVFGKKRPMRNCNALKALSSNSILKGKKQFKSIIYNNRIQLVKRFMPNSVDVFVFDTPLIMFVSEN